MMPLCSGVGRDELLAETVVLAGGAKAAGLEDEAVVRLHHRRGTRRTECAEPRITGLLDGSLGLLGPALQGELEADDLAIMIMAVDYGGQVARLWRGCVVSRDLTAWSQPLGFMGR